MVSRPVTPLAGDYLSAMVCIRETGYVKSWRWREEEEAESFLPRWLLDMERARNGLHNLHMWRLGARFWSNIHKLWRLEAYGDCVKSVILC